MSRGPVVCTGIATTPGMADLERGSKEFLSPMIVRHEARTLSVMTSTPGHLGGEDRFSCSS